VPRVCFTSHLERHVACPADSVPGASARQVLEAYFARHAEVRPYVLDELGRLRRHVVLFVDGEQVRDRHDLSDPVAADSEVYVMQALSGG
jgi:molybdopterin synthase sulfur carrier subunit